MDSKTQKFMFPISSTVNTLLFKGFETVKKLKEVSYYNLIVYKTMI